MDYKIDAIDKRIIQLLQQDGKMKIKEVAHALKMTTTPIFDRIKRLEKEGFIETSGKRIKITNKIALQKLAEGIQS